MKYGWNKQSQYWNRIQANAKRKYLRDKGHKAKITKRKALYFRNEKRLLYTVWLWNPFKK